MMRNTTNYVYLTHHELLKTITIVRAVKQAALRRHNKAEVRLMNELLSRLINFDLDSSGSVVILDSMSRYNLWNYVEQYIEYCAETKQHIEYALAVTISTKLSG